MNLERALKKAENAIKIEDGFSYRANDDHGYISGEYDFENESFNRTRFDVELSRPAVNEMGDEGVAEVIFLCLRTDLEELIEHGDSQSPDILLRTFDGARKRKQRPVDIEIIHLHLSVDFNKVKDAYEYTIYTVVYVKWE